MLNHGSQMERACCLHSTTASTGSRSSDVSASADVNRTSGIETLGSNGSEHLQDGNIRRMLGDHDFPPSILKYTST